MDYNTMRKALNDPLQEQRREFIFSNLKSDYKTFLEGSEDYTYEELLNILKQTYKLAMVFKEMFKLRPDETILYNAVRRDLTRD